MDVLDTIERRLQSGAPEVTFDEALALTELGDDRVPDLVRLAHQVRLRYCGDAVELESLISAKTGGCPEDCAFCSQSVHFESPITIQPLLNPEEILEGARATEAAGASQYCIVVAVRGPSPSLMRSVLRSIELIHANTSLKVDCSLGILTREQALELKNAGIHHYNHNLEAARSFFPEIVTSHTWEERYETCRLVKEVGLGLCSGGIFGMGETWRQRIEMAFALLELGVDEIPLNFLNPRPGTPLADQPLLPALDAIRIGAIYRLIHPTAILRYAGGRELVVRDLQALGLMGGVNALIVGNYLTTTGRPPEQDLQLVNDLQMPVRP